MKKNHRLLLISGWLWYSTWIRNEKLRTTKGKM
jgi:hypothetical protein